MPLCLTQWIFWYCNDVGITSPSISPWHSWYIVNETHYNANLRYQPDIRILRLDQSDFSIVIATSWYRTPFSRKKSSRIVYHFRISHNNVTFILWQLKIEDIWENENIEVIRTLRRNVQKTFLYCPTCNVKGSLLPTSWGRLLQTL